MKKFDWLLTEGVFLLEGYQPPLFPKLDYDPEYAAKLTEQAGAKILRFPAMAYYAYYPTEYYVQHPELNRRDLLRETIDACHKKGIKVFTYIPVGHPFLPHDSDLEPYNSWAKLDENGNRITWWHHGYFKTYYICLNSPYREAIRKITGEIVNNYDIDGVYFDGPYQDQTSSGDFCYCPHCRAAYKKKTGKEIPTSKGKRDWNDPDTVEYLRWVIDDVKRGLMKELNAIIKQKDIPHLFNNCGWLANKYWGGDRYRDIDGFMFEGVHTSQEKLLHVMLGRSVDKYIWSYMGSYHATVHDHFVTDIEGSVDYAAISVYGDELKNEGYTIISGNAVPIFYSMNRVYYQQDDISNVNEVFGFLEKNKELLQKVRNKPFIGMCVSGNSRDWWFKNEDDKNRKYRCFIYGGFNVLKDLCHQVEPFYMSEQSEADFNRYKIVFLPNAACISNYEAEKIKNYVLNGGNLIATYMTSLFDECGNLRENFALSDVFGVDRAECIEKEIQIRRDSYLKIVKEHPVSKGFKTGRLIPQDLQFLTINAHNPDEVIAVTTGVGHDLDVSASIIARNYGKGKVVYISGGLEALYRTSRFKDIAALFDNIIRWMSGDEIPYETDTPGLIVNMAEGPGYALYHIINNNGVINKYAPTRECFVPVYNVKIRILTNGRKIKSIKLLVRDTDIEYTDNGKYIEGLLPDIHFYECVYVQFED